MGLLLGLILIHIILIVFIVVIVSGAFPLGGCLLSSCFLCFRFRFTVIVTVSRITKSQNPKTRKNPKKSKIDSAVGVECRTPSSFALVAQHQAPSQQDHSKNPIMHPFE
jgi:hypothetical protein